MKVLTTTLGALSLVAACTGSAAPPAFTSCDASVAYYKTRIGAPMTEPVDFSPHRILSPHSIVTMDYNPGRLNVYIDDRGMIIDARCG